MNFKHEPCIFPSLDGGGKEQGRSKIYSSVSKHLCRATQDNGDSASVDRFIKASWALSLHRYTQDSVVTFGFVQETSSSVNPQTTNVITEVEQWEVSKAADAKIRHLHTKEWGETEPNKECCFNTCVLVRGSPRSGDGRYHQCVGQLLDVFGSKCGVVVGVHEDGTGFHLSLEYECSLFGGLYASELLSLFAYTLETQQLSGTPQMHVKDLSPSNLETISRWNADDNHCIPKECIHVVIQQQCYQTPNSQAVCAWDGSLTYRELESLSKILQGYLQNLGIGPESVVPIYMERSMWVVVCLLGVLKAGGAFLLMDTAYPRNRIAYMCREVKASVILSSGAMKDQIRDLADVILDPSQLNSEAAPEPSKPNVEPNNAAYLAYTSGSTGLPKAVVNEHSGFLAGGLTHSKAMGMNSRSRVLHFSSHGFDISLMDLLTPLGLGGCVCIPSEQQRWDDLPQAMADLKVNWAFLTPSVARRIEPDAVPQLETLAYVGEAMLPIDEKIWSQKVRLIVAYGPAECGAICSINADINAPSVTNIGRPCSGSMWVVSPSDHNQLQPIGAVGELLISGSTVARGYLSQDTGAFLQQAPSWGVQFGLTSNERFYKTGDLVRYEGDKGALFYLGRKDRQVKMNGQRIELQEIEHVAQEIKAGITAAAEVFSHPATKESLLVLFVTREGSLCQQDEAGRPEIAKDESSRATISSLQESLKGRLPQFMVPTVYIPLQYMPLNPSAKLDRKLLRTIGDEFLESRSQGNHDEDDDQTDNESRTDTESILRRVCADVLNLRKKRVRANDDFFSLGGSSLTAIHFVAKARDKGLSLRVIDVLRLKTCANMVSAVRKRDQDHDPARFELINNLEEWLATAKTQCEIGRDMIQDMYPCSPLQAGLMFLSKRNPGSMVVTYAFRIRKDVNVNLLRFQKAWQAVVASNPILRTRIIQLDNNELVQAVIKADEQIQWGIGRSLDEVIGILEAKEMGFGLPLIHPGFVIGRDSEASFVLTMHHSVFDGWSVTQFWNDLHTAYQTEQTLSQRPCFSRFIRYIMGQNPTGAKKFWTQEFQGLQAVTFPPRPTGWKAPLRTCIHRLEVPINSSNRAKPWPIIIHLAWALVVANMTHTNDVVFGTTVSGRTAPVPGIDRIGGPTIATYPLRIQLTTSMSVEETLMEIRERSAARIEFEHTGLQTIRRFSSQAAMAVDFQTLLTVLPETEKASMLVDLPENHYQQFKFNTHILSIVAQLTQDSIIVEAIYDASVLPSDQIKSMCDRLSHIIQQISNQPSLRIKDIKIVTKEEERSLNIWNQTKQSEDDGPCLHNLIIAAGQKNPEAQAVCSWDGTLCYRDLLQLSRSVSGYLESLNVAPESVVGIYMEKSQWLTVAVVGTLLAGAAFLLLDPKLPAQRLRDICRDANVRIALSSKELMSQDKNLLAKDIFITSTEDAAQSNYAWKAQSVCSSNLMYVMFTSGSTGTPKGVLIEHRMCMSTYQGYISRLPLSSSVRMLFLASMSFDISVLQLLFPLAAGGCVCIPSEDECMSDLAGVITRQRINWLATTPSVARTLNPVDVPVLKTLELGGELMLPSDLTRWDSFVDLWTSYGPAECAIVITSGPVTKHSTQGAGYIGHALNGSCWVVNPNDHHQLQPHGTIGELLVGGPSVARGYLNKPLETENSFIGPPEWTRDFPSAQAWRFYKTGDLVSYDNEGGLHYVGRKDNQVKHHGQRIELTEIEHCARNYDSNLGVVADLVIFPDPHGVRLVLFVSKTLTAQHDAETNELPLVKKFNYTLSQELLSHFTENMPGYMVPSVIICVEYLPLSHNGKLDRRRLRTAASRLDRDTLHRLVAQPLKKRAPATKQQSIVRNAFARVLGIDESIIGVDDCFFALGGDSILAMRLLSLCREANVEFKMVDLLVYRSVAGICQHAKAVVLTNNRLPGISAAKAHELGRKICDHLDLKSVELIEDMYPCCESHVGLLVGLTGHGKDHSVCDIQELLSSHPIDPFLVTKAWRLLVSRHRILRTVVVHDLVSGVGPFHVVLKEVEPKLRVLPWTSDPIQALKSLPRTTNWKNSPPNSFAVCQGLDGRVIIRIESGYTMIDGTSVSILLQDFCRLVNGEISLPEPALYRNYIEHVRQLPLAPTKQYWKKSLMGARSCVFQSPSNLTSSPELHMACVHMDNSKVLDEFWRAHGLTLTNVFQLTWAVILRRYTGTSDTIFGSVVAGRDYPVPGVMQVVGPCINILPCRIQLDDKQQILDLLKHNQVEMQNRIDHQNYSMPDILKMTESVGQACFNTCLTVQPTLSSVMASSQNATATLRLVENYDPTEFDLSVVVCVSPERLELQLRYWTSSCTKDMAATLLDEFQTTATQISRHPYDSLANITRALFDKQ